MDFATGAGGTFSLSATKPATFTEAGYTALTPTLVGKITNIDGVPTRTYNEVTLNYLASAGEDVAKGSYSLGSSTLTVALDASDAGQILLQTANNSTATYSVKLAHPKHGTIWAQALIFGQQKTWGDNDTPSTWEVTVRYKMATYTDDGIVVVPAA
jgi:hypothetical protein